MAPKIYMLFCDNKKNQILSGNHLSILREIWALNLSFSESFELSKTDQFYPI
jgi:hypothetical protein